MKNLLSSFFKKEWHLPLEEKISRLLRAFSPAEKFLFYMFAVLFSASAVLLLFQVSNRLTAETPDYGGTMTEGVIGAPRFINPLLAVSETDRDLTSLVYSGLLKVSNGQLVPDLAESYSISDDGLVYTFTLRDHAVFQDGAPVTADDVLFTISMAQDEKLKSPRKPQWDGVKAAKLDDRTVTLTLSRAYSPFIQNTTLGILPKHIWKNAGPDEFPFSQFNIKPIGSGAYSVESISYTGSGLPSSYTFVSFDRYALGRPYITRLVIKTYQSEKDLSDAFKNGDVESVHGISPDTLSPLIDTKKTQLLSAPLPRVFGVFFNQNTAPIFVNAEVRQALDIATDKEAIIANVLSGYGQVADGPAPFSDEVASDPTASDRSAEAMNERVAEARALLESKGWKENDVGVYEKTDKNKKTATLSFSISTGNIPELKQAALLLQEQWRKIGAEVDVKIFETGDLNQNIIRPRKYDALLFGEIVGRDLDLYPFWHSSERNDPGLNIALYANVKADGYLEKIRETADPDKRQSLYQSFKEQIDADRPAVFLYSPHFVYAVPQKVKNIRLSELTNPSERWSDIENWYIETNKVWNIFIETASK